MLRSADVAKMLPCVPAAMTATEAMKTMKSEGTARLRGARGLSQILPCPDPKPVPITQKGFLAKRKRPRQPR